MTWLAIILIVLFLLDALRLRGRLSGLETASGGSAEGSGSTRPLEVFSAEGATLNEEALVRAEAWGAARGLDVVDVVPVGWGASDAMAFAQLVDTRAFRAGRFEVGRTAGVALLASSDVVERSGESAGPRSSAEMIELAVELKRLAPATMDHVAVEGAVSPHIDGPTRQRLVLTALGRNGYWGAAAAVPVVLALIAWLIVDDWVWGLATLGAWQLQPLIALSGLAPRFSGVELLTALRLPIELKLWATTYLRGLPSKEAEEDSGLRAEYAELIAGGTEPFFEPRRETCPICEAGELSVRLKTVDLLQHKPGEFTLEKCGGCGHIFQNPRLSIEGLNYYYKDFYDGRGEELLDFIFATAAHSYAERAELLKGHATPKAWLDVGGGHGHFSCAARDVWPETRFDGLDMSESIEEATRRGWVDNGFRGLFPDLAGDVIAEGSYDVVSMSHYLEHTREPRDEIAAAARVLESGGHLLIEVPDPECWMPNLLGRHWVPWFQPQHQHLLPIGVLETVLDEHGFDTVVRHRGEAHQPVDLAFATMFAVGRLSPTPDEPWRPPPSGARRVGHAVVWSVGTLFMGLAALIDNLIAPLMRRPGRSNTYRVLARRR